MGKLVLSKGQSSDNGKIGVTVVDIIPPDRCAEPGSYRGSSRVVLRFFDAADSQVICENTFAGEGGHNIGSDGCGSSLDLSGVNTYGVNTKDGWVYFELFSSR